MISNHLIVCYVELCNIQLFISNSVISLSLSLSLLVSLSFSLSLYLSLPISLSIYIYLSIYLSLSLSLSLSLFLSLSQTYKTYTHSFCLFSRSLQPKPIRKDEAKLRKFQGMVLRYFSTISDPRVSTEGRSYLLWEVVEERVLNLERKIEMLI